MPMPTFTLARLGHFRSELHACFTRRADALFELGDALLRAPAITSVAQLSLEPSHRRGWGSSYAALASGFPRLLCALGSPASTPKLAGRSPGPAQGPLLGSRQAPPGDQEARQDG